MLVMVSNLQTDFFLDLSCKYGNIGNLFSPFSYSKRTLQLKKRSWTPSLFLPYSLDNGKFITYSHNISWDKDLFISHCDRIFDFYLKPLWIVVPDVVGNREQTLDNWCFWESLLRKYGVPLAIAVQDGMTVNDIHNLNTFRDTDFIFVGGSTLWKLQTLCNWTANFKNVHCGRVNTWKRLWQCYHAGCTSVDGTGYFYKKQQHDLELFLQISSGNIIFHTQLSLF